MHERVSETGVVPSLDPTVSGRKFDRVHTAIPTTTIPTTGVPTVAVPTAGLRPN